MKLNIELYLVYIDQLYWFNVMQFSVLIISIRNARWRKIPPSGRNWSSAVCHVQYVSKSAVAKKQLRLIVCIFFLIEKNKNRFVFIPLYGLKMDLKKFGNFNWIEMDSKDQNLDLTRTKRIHFCLLGVSFKKYYLFASLRMFS